MTDKNDADKIAAYLAREEAFTRDLYEIAKGGKGSGNFGHRGRPGERGGSSTDGGGGTTAPKPSAPAPAPAAPPQPAAPAVSTPTVDQHVGNMFRERYGQDGTKWPKEAKEAFLKVQMVYHEDKDPIVFKDGSKASVATNSLGHITVAYTKPDGQLATRTFANSPNQGGKEVNVREAAAWMRQVHEGEIPLDAAPKLALPKGAADPKDVPAEYKKLSLEDAHAYAKDKLGVDVKLPKASPEAQAAVLNKMNEAFTMLHNAGYYVPKTVEGERMGGRALAGWNLKGNAGDYESGNIAGRMELNKASVAFTTADGMQQLIDDNYAGKFFSTNHPLQLFVHEAGHMNHYYQKPGDYAGSSLWDYGMGRGRVIPTFLALKVRHRVEWGTAERKIASKVSDYGKSDPGEFIAETFAGIVLGKSYGKDVMDLYDKLGGPKPVRKK